MAEKPDRSVGGDGDGDGEGDGDGKPKSASTDDGLLTGLVHHLGKGNNVTTTRQVGGVRSLGWLWYPCIFPPTTTSTRSPRSSVLRDKEQRKAVKEAEMAECSKPVER